MSNKGIMSRRPTVLSDHKKNGKRFIPPFIATIGKLSEVSWVNQIIPQLIWIAILIDTYGFIKGVEYSLAIAQCAKESVDSKELNWFGWLSSFSSLSEQQKSSVREKLEVKDILDEVCSAFSSFAALYPNFPLSFLTFTASNNTEYDAPEIDRIKRIITDLYDRRSIFATRVQATVIYLAFVNDFLKVAKGLVLADFPEVEKYPDTERSKEVAAMVRAVINSFAGEFENSGFNSWSSYFWNRGLEIEPCIPMDNKRR